MVFTDWDRLTIDGLTPEGVKAIKESLRTLEGIDFSLLTTAQLTSLQEMVNAMRFFMPMILVEQPIIDIVRVTKNPRDAEGYGTRIHRISRLKYPPEGKVKIEMGRANFPNRSVLYGSFFGLTSLAEMRIEAGDLVTRTEWRMITYLDRIKTTCVFHDARILERLPYFKNFHDTYQALLAKRSPLEAEVIQATNGFVARQFTKKVSPDKRVNYLVSAFIGDLWLNQNKVDALVYPSVQVDLLDACIAMRPSVFDDMFYPVRSRELLINSAEYASTTAVATQFDVKTDTINWDSQKSYNDQQLSAFQRQRAEERAGRG
jgi:RES domain